MAIKIAISNHTDTAILEKNQCNYNHACAYILHYSTFLNGLVDKQ